MRAPPETPVVGTVTSPDGAPVKNARVIVYPAAMSRGEVPATASTDDKGRFRLETSFVGELLVCVDVPGFAPRSSIPVRPGVSVAVQLEKGRALEGTVRDAITRRPLASARVFAGALFPFAAADPRAGRREALTDAGGKYRLEHLPEQVDGIQATAKGYARVFATVLPTAARVDLTLSRGAWLSGTVRTATGVAVKGAVVTATAFDYSTSPAGRHGREETDGLGRFEILGLAPGLFYLAAHHPGFAPAFAPPVRVRESLSVDLVLKDATTAAGRLVDADGRPTAGTVVLEELESGFPTLLGNDVLRATAGPDGRFRLRDLPPGRHQATVSVRGHTPTRLEFQTREGAAVDLGDVPLTIGLAIRGQIRDAKGAPLVGSRVEAVSVDGRGGYAADAADSEGAFALTGLGDGRYRLSVTVGSVYRASREVNAGAEPIVWALEPTGAVTGEVIDVAGRPIGSFFVTARSSDEGMGWGSPHVKGDAGAFRIDQVPPGRYTLRVTAPDHADAVVGDVVVEAEGTADAGRIRLGPAGRVRGTVVDEDGRPVADAEVRTLSQRDHESGTLSHGAPEARTTEDGSFEIGGLNPGALIVVAHHARLGSGQAAGLDVDPSHGATAVRVVLQAGGRVEGKVRRSGKALAATVSAMAFSGFARERFSTVTEDDGSFALDNLSPGQFMLDFLPVDQQTQSLPQRLIWVHKGETTTLDVDFREILVRGRVTPAGAAVEGLCVAFDTEGRRTSWLLKGGPGPQHMVSPIAADGSYSLLLSQPGPHTARVERADGTVLHSRPVVVPDADEHRLDLELASLSIRGVLVDESTQVPIANGEVGVARGNATDIIRPARTGPDGRFDLPLEPGTNVLYARAPGYASTRSPLEVGPQGVADQRIALMRGSKIRGRVVDARGQSAAGVMVLASGERSPEPLANAQTAADGSFELTGLGEARYNLFAGSDLTGFAIQAGVRPDTADTLLTLRSPGRVRVTVQDAAGAPAGGVILLITGVDGLTVLGISSFFSMTDADGVVELSVPVGRIELSAQHRTGAGSAVVEVGTGDLAQAAIRLAAQGASP